MSLNDAPRLPVQILMRGRKIMGVLGKLTMAVILTLIYLLFSTSVLYADDYLKDDVKVICSNCNERFLLLTNYKESNKILLYKYSSGFSNKFTNSCYVFPVSFLFNDKIIGETDVFDNEPNLKDIEKAPIKKKKPVYKSKLLSTGVTLTNLALFIYCGGSAEDNYDKYEKSLDNKQCLEYKTKTRVYDFLKYSFAGLSCISLGYTVYLFF